jgi:iron complex outermembrane recepter protein
VSNDDEIIVTARRRAESLQDVPLAVTAVTAEQLENIGAADITALQRATPNVTFEVSRGTNSTLTAFIRGIGQQDPLWGFEPGIGLYIDDVYVSRPQGSLLDVYDVERLEVLRGPQGTLYGRNTIGGAIKYVTKRIGDEPEGQIRGAVGSYNQADIVVSGSMPINDWLAVGGAFANLTRGGYGKNVVTGAEHFNKDVVAGRASLEFTPSDSIFVRVAYDRTEDDSNAKHGHREVNNVNPSLPVLPDVYDTRAGIGSDNHVETQGASVQAEWIVNDNLTLKSITAWREGQTQTPIDFDGTQARDLDVPAYYGDEQVSQEFQAQIELGPLTGVAGVFYLNGVADGAFDTILGALGPLTVYTYGKVNTQSLSVFGDFTYALNDQWKISAGGRYTEDVKEGTVLRQNYLGLGSPFVSRANTTLLGTATNFRRERTDEKFSPRVSVSYEPTDTLTLYASYSQGFKSGGFDPRANFAATSVALQPRILQGFGPEQVDSYEAGLKGAFLDRRLLLSSAVFFADYKDQQVTVQSGADTNNDGVNDTFVSSVFNAGASEYFGVEIEGSFALTDNWKTIFSLGYIDAEITEVITAGVNVQADANPANDFVPQNTPEKTAQLGLQYSGEFNGGGVVVTGNLSYRDEYFIFNVPNNGFGPRAGFPNGGPRLDPKENLLVDLSAVWTSEDDRWSFGLHGKNLTDERYKVALYNFITPSQLGVESSYSAFYGPPRTVTATVGVKF